MAVGVGEVAAPFTLVIAIAVCDPPKLALAPLDGAVNVTVTPETGLFPASLTVATNAAPNAVLIAALCPEPDVTAMLAGGPAVLVNANWAPWMTPVNGTADIL